MAAWVARTALERGRVRGAVGPPLGHQQRRAEHRDDDERGAEEDPGAEREPHDQYRRPCCG